MLVVAGPRHEPLRWRCPLVAVVAGIAAAVGLFVLAGATPAALGLLADIVRALPHRPRRDHGPLLGLPRDRPDHRPPSSAASRRTGAASTGCSRHAPARSASPSCRWPGCAAQEHQLEPAGAGRPRPGERARGRAGVTDRAPVGAGARSPAARTARSSRRTISRPPPGSRSCGPAGSAVDAAIATNAALGVVHARHACGIGGDAFWLIWDAAAGRQDALNGSGRAGSRADAAFLRASGPDASSRPRPAVDHRPGRGPLVGRRARAARAAVAGRDPGPGHRAGTGRVPGHGTASSTRSSGRRPRSPPRSALGRRLLRGLPAARPAMASRRAGPAPGAGGHASRRSPTTASTPSTRATWRTGRRACSRTLGGLITLGDLARAHARRGASRSRSTTAGRPGRRAIRRTARASSRWSCWRSCRRFEAPPSAAFGPDGVTDPAWIHLGHRGGEAGDGRPRRAT